MRIGILAALPGELKPLVRGWLKLPVVRGSGIQMWQQQTDDDECIAVCAGMGSAAALRAFTAAEHAGSLDMVLSIGWCGATASTFTAPSCYLVQEIIDPQTGERFQATGGRQAIRLVSTPKVVDEREKRRLWQAYAAGLVDMEAATVGRLARMRDIPLVCIKAVSDDADALLPDLNPYINPQGQLRTAAFLAHVAVSPQYWGGMARLAGNTGKGAEALGRAVRLFLETKSIEPLLQHESGETPLCTG